MGMLYSVLIGATVLFFMLLLRRKKYDISLVKCFALHIVVTILTTLGANFGSFIGGMSLLGLRLYGILLLDTFALFVLARVFKIEIGMLGDYLGPGIIAVCCIVKVPCIIDGCCYGKELFVNSSGVAVRFPSQIVEFSIWALLTIWLIWIERKGNHKNYIWAITSIWFGIIRFLVDFMRGNAVEMRLEILGMPAGRFWSLVVAILGCVLLFLLFRKYQKRSPSIKEMLRLIIGMKASKN